MLFADGVPTPSESQFLGFILGGIGVLSTVLLILSCALAWKKLFEAKKPEEQLVNQSQLNELRTSIAGCALKTDVVKVSQDIEKVSEDVEKVSENIDQCATKVELKDFQSYARDSFHKIANDMNSLNMSMAVVQTNQTAQKDLVSNLIRKVDSGHDIMLKIHEAVSINKRLPVNSVEMPSGS